MPAVTVWSLELRDAAGVRPPARAPQRPSTIVRTTDPAVSPAMYERVGAAHSWTDRAHWTPDRWRAWTDRVETWVLRVDGGPAGYFELDGPRDGSVELAYFGLVAEAQGLGLGGHLLTAALRRGFELADRVSVSTCSLDGPHALANYQARGLELVRTDTVLR
jgi:GNAT superfamily N-acetyltransferase